MNTSANQNGGQQRKRINIEDANIDAGWEWLVFKLRSQRARKNRLSGSAPGKGRKSKSDTAI
jgi:hypothetical protein